MGLRPVLLTLFLTGTIVYVCLSGYLISETKKSRLAAPLPTLMSRNNEDGRKPKTRLNETQRARVQRLRQEILAQRLQPLVTDDPNRPPLSSILHSNGTIIGDPQFLLDFVIAGFGKCGTSTLMHWLADHFEIQAFREESWELMHSEPHTLIYRLYRELPANGLHGYKGPGEITQAHILGYLRTYFPKTKLILGVRHPIRWFESLYNFRIQNLDVGDEMPHPNKLVGRCLGGMFHTCTEKANYAYYLLRLGKQVQLPNHEYSEMEEDIVGHYRKQYYNLSAVEYMPNPVFLYEITQLPTLAPALESFLGLKTPLPPLPHVKPGLEWHAEIQEQKDSLKIEICDDEYERVRQELLRLGKQSSEWIRTVLLHSPDVVTANRTEFEELLDAWSQDPCESPGV